MEIEEAPKASSLSSSGKCDTSGDHQCCCNDSYQLHKAEFTGCPTSPAWTVLSPELPPDSQTFMPGTSVTCRMDEEQLHRSHDVFARPRSRADYASSSPLAQRSMRSATFRAKLMPRLAHQTFPTALYRDCSILILVPERLWFLAAHFRSLAQVYRFIAQNK
jgi:hypothetical protein